MEEQGTTRYIGNLTMDSCSGNGEYPGIKVHGNFEWITVPAELACVFVPLSNNITDAVWELLALGAVDDDIGYGQYAFLGLAPGLKVKSSLKTKFFPEDDLINNWSNRKMVCNCVESSCWHQEDCGEEK